MCKKNALVLLDNKKNYSYIKNIKERYIKNEFHCSAVQSWISVAMVKLLILLVFCFELSCSAESPPVNEPHPETIGDFHEGDIVSKENDEQIEFNGIVNENYKWPKTVQFVMVPYEISSAFSKFENA